MTQLPGRPLIGGGDHPVFSPEGRLLFRSYSHDGEWIVHATDGVADEADIFVIRADGTGNRPVTRTAPWDSAPDWGPAGS